MLGVILGFISKSKSKEAGLKINNMALAGIIISFIYWILSMLVCVIFIFPIIDGFVDRMSDTYISKDDDSSKVDDEEADEEANKDDDQQHNINGERYNISITKNTAGDEDVQHLSIELTDTEKNRSFSIESGDDMVSFWQLQYGKIISEEEDYVVVDTGTSPFRTNVVLRLKTEDVITFTSFSLVTFPIFWNGYYIFTSYDFDVKPTRPWEGGHSTSIYYINPETNNVVKIMPGSENDDYKIKSLVADTLNYSRFVFNKSTGDYDSSKEELLTVDLKTIIR